MQNSQTQINQFFKWHTPGSFGFLQPYIIAEIGVNHGGDVTLAKKQILLAKESGAHAVKFQAYKASLIASKEYSPSYWDLSKERTSSQYELFSRYDTLNVEDYNDLANFCRKNNIDFACTPFDHGAVDFLDSIVPFFKIASADITNIPLLKKVAQTHKPVILSVGASHWNEIHSAVRLLQESGCTSLCLLHCVLNYPTPVEHAQMKLQDELLLRYSAEALIGYSDHVAESLDGFPVLDIAVLRGAMVIEKHFTHDPNLPGNDHYHAFSPESLQSWNKRLGVLREAYGTESSRNMDWERLATQNARRRVVLAKPKQAGDIIYPEDIIPLRANQGIEIQHYDSVVGRCLNKDKQERDILSWSDLS